MTFDHAHERQLVRYLYHRIRDDLTGESVEQILGDVPRDRLHAGVLLPLELAETSSVGLAAFITASDEAATPVPRVDTNSSLSLDFQVRLANNDDCVTLRIRPRVSVYYAASPTYQEARLHHSTLASGEAAEAPLDINQAEEDAADPLAQETVPDTDLLQGTSPSLPRQVADETLAAMPVQPAGQEETIILPLKFRRCDIEVPTIEIRVPPSRLMTPMELRDELTTALATARAAILRDDPTVWKHLGRPQDGLREVRGVDILANQHNYEAVLDAAQGAEVALPSWRAYLTITATPVLASDARTFRINVALVNATPALPRAERQRARIEECALFNCGLEVESIDVELVPFVFHGTADDYRLDRSLSAIGSNCAVVTDGGRLRTETVPLFEQPWYRTRNGLSLRFAELDDSLSADPLARLEDLAHAMDDYLAEWDGHLATAVSVGEFDESQAQACQRDRVQFAREISRFKLGLDCLRREPQLLRAFRLMNRVFRESGERRRPAITTWRLFQIAFIVMELPALAVREVEAGDLSDYGQQLEASLRRVDVLWFPTGGGKTEAYLGLITTALFFDRLRGKDRGVTAWMRFPLRMLSLQQLERLARILAQAEVVRATEPDLRQSGDPFAIGYYVGGGNTPNRIRDTELQSLGRGAGRWDRQQVIRHCPFCAADVAIKFDPTSWRLQHVCGNPKCFSNTSASLGDLRGSLPILVVDTEIYRYRPAVLVGTVDKLAVLGMQRYFAHLISSVEQRCPEHGYASLDQCVEAVASGPCTIKPKDFIRLTPERDPGPTLLIQDELHLLKEELGTFNAHYEGFLDYLPRKQGGRPPKVLAATATIEAYETQAFHLYLKDAIRFPQPSWLAGESFYATSAPLIYRRLYAGVMTHQRSPEAATLRALEVYHRELQRLAADPAAARTVLGFETISNEDLAAALHLYDLSLTYVNQKATGGNIAYNLNQTVSPRLQQRLSVEMLTGDNTMTEVGQVVEQIERELEPTEGQRLDALIATSLISHGVDLERINFLCMVGMPSRFAEYIQASSRAARNHVGLVLVCFKRGDLRERSQYHYFFPNHRYLDRLVESVPINRFSAFAVKRTVPGLLTGLLLADYSRTLLARRLITRPLDRLATLRKAVQDGYLDEAVLLEDLKQIIGSEHPHLSDLQRRHLSEAIADHLHDNWERLMRSLESGLFDAVHPMTSFRDIDEALDFVSDGPAAAFVERLQAN